MMLSQTRQVLIALSDRHRPHIPGELLGFVPAVEQRKIESGNQILSIYTVDALVRLDSFEHNSLYQIPLDRLKVNEEKYTHRLYTLEQLKKLAQEHATEIAAQATEWDFVTWLESKE